MATPPSSNPPSRPGSSGSNPTPPPPPHVRAVSGSLKDRIAKFNNPSAAPLVPNHPFGSSGPPPSSQSYARGGLVGNRIPSLDPKTAGMINAGRRVSETKGLGLIGNRIPSGAVPAPAFSKPSGRSASPAGSVDSSTASGQMGGSSVSPHESRTSSPPSSPGMLDRELPSHLLSAELPDMGGPGAMTPSSTRADAGESTFELSAPTTPVAGNMDLPPPDMDLLTGNVAQIGNAPNPLSALAAPSITSSVRSQYDPSSKDSEELKMMDDVSGISTPMGTPRAARRDLEGSMAGSVRGEGSVADVDEVAERMEGLKVAAQGKEDKDVTPEPIQHDLPDVPPTPTTQDNQGPTEAATQEPLSNVPQDSPAPNEQPQFDAVETKEIASTADIDEVTGPGPDTDPNTDSDLADLKAGRLGSPSAEVGANFKPDGVDVLNSMAGQGMAQRLGEHVIPHAEKKEQGGVAGQRMDEVEVPDEVIEPKETAVPEYDEGGIDVETAKATSENTTEKPTSDNTAEIAQSPNEAKSAGQSDQNGNVDQIEETWARLGGPDKDMTVKAEVSAHGARPQTLTEVEDQAREMEKRKYDAKREEEREKSQQERELHDKGEGPAVAGEVTTDSDRAEGDEASPGPVIGPDTVMNIRLHPETHQFEIEPAPIAQPAAESADAATNEAVGTLGIDETADGAKTPVPPDFPEPPTVDPDVVDPTPEAAPEAAEGAKADQPATPVDPHFLKAFPDVPSEEKPRVEVHVSTPNSTPSKVKTLSETPIAHIPGHAKSASDTAAHDFATPRATSRNSLDETPVGGAGIKRANSRRSPKSPLLDDEDPGDYEAGEDGWAVVTKGRDA